MSSIVREKQAKENRSQFIHYTLYNLWNLTRPRINTTNSNNNNNNNNKETPESYNFKDKNKNNQLIFTISNYIFENTYTILKTKLCVHDNKLFTICEY